MARAESLSIHLHGKWNFLALSMSSPSRLTTSCCSLRARATFPWTNGIRSTILFGQSAAGHPQTRSTWFWMTISNLVKICDVLSVRWSKPRPRLISTGSDPPSEVFRFPQALGGGIQNARAWWKQLLRHCPGLKGASWLQGTRSKHGMIRDGNQPVFVGDKRKLESD